MISKTLKLYKQSYGGLSKENWWLALIMLVNRSGTMVVPFMTIYLTSPEMGYSISQAGIVMGFFGVGAILGGYFGGKATDRFGFKKVQLFALAGGGILFFIVGELKSLPMICMFTLILSLVNESFRPANATAVAWYSNDQNRTRCYSLNRLAVNLGWALGAALGGLLASIDFKLLFWVDGITNIAAAMILYRLLAINIDAVPGERTERTFSKSAYQDRMYLVFIALTILFALCFFQMFSTLTAFFKLDIGFSSFYIGLLMAINGLVITFIEMVIVYKLEGRHNSTFYIPFGVFLCSIAYLMLNLFHINHLTAALMIIVITFGEIMSMPFMNAFWASRSNQSNRGQYAGLYTIAWSIAHTVGPLFGSLIAQHQGFTVLWWIISAMCFLTGIGFLLLHKLRM
jgi:predicted MFS family arabinose efflux permease